MVGISHRKINHSIENKASGELATGILLPPMLRLWPATVAAALVVRVAPAGRVPLGLGLALG